MTRPICAPIRSMRSGSKLAPQHSGDGYTVACQAASPVRHSSCTMAGIPCRPGRHDLPLDGGHRPGDRPPG